MLALGFIKGSLFGMLLGIFLKKLCRNEVKKNSLEEATLNKKKT